MHITELRVRHFRNFVKARFRFCRGVNTLIGENGAGKTNALHALRLLLDESLERNAIYLREQDFCRDLKSWRGEWIIIAADFADLDPSEGCQLLKHSTGHMNGSNTGTCTFYFRPKAEVRKKLHELSGKASEAKGYLKTLTINDYEPLMTGRASADLLDDTVYHQCAGDVASATFPDPTKDDQNVMGVKLQPIYAEVACTFVRALRDVIADLKGYRANPLLNLLRGMESTIEIADATKIANKVSSLNNDISTLKEIQGLASGIESALKKAVGYTYGPSVSIESALPDSMEKLLQRLIVLVGDAGLSSYRGELHDQGLGGANLIYLALKLLEYEAKLSSDRVAHFFLIEEPEAHIHTHIQKTLFSNLPSSKTQVIVSTHSTHVSSASKISSVNVLAKKGDHAEVFQPAAGLTSAEVTHLERYLDAVRSTLLFAKGVVLVEGDAEQILIPAMLRAVFNTSPDELGFSVISMSSAFFDHLAVLFDEKRIQRPCAIVTDLDRALCDLPADPNDDDSDQSAARAAQKAGENRRNRLEVLSSGNDWVETFFADHTFEVEFIAANNSREVIRTLNTIYQDPGARQRSKTRLDSGDVQVSGKECLRLANKCGKGWFALLLSECVDSWTFFPEYILRAIAFACAQTIGEAALKRMGEYRLRVHNSDALQLLAKDEDLDQLSPEAFLEQFSEADPEDSLSRFYEYLQEYRPL